MKLCFVLPAISTCGGIERVVTCHANYFAGVGAQVEIVVFDDPLPAFFCLDGNVRIVNIRRAFPNGGFIGRAMTILRLRRHFEVSRPNAVVSLFNNLKVVSATVGLHIPTLLTEHMDPGNDPLDFVRGRMQRLLYPLAAKVVSVSHGVDRQFAWLAPEKRTVIHNPIADAVTRSEIVDPLPRGRRYLLAVGRFVRQKGFDILLDVFAQIASRHPEWDLCVLGGAPTAEYLAAVNRLGIADRVHFPGRVVDVSPYFRQAELYVLSSRHEAFPMVLLEAMLYGLPAISFDCPSGPREVIEHGKSGWLAPAQDRTALSRFLELAMSDAQWRTAASKHALATAERFTLDKIMPLWEELFLELGVKAP